MISLLLQLEDDDTSVFTTPASTAVMSEDVDDSSALKSDGLRVCLRASAANQYITGEEEQINRVSTCTWIREKMRLVPTY